MSALVRAAEQLVGCLSRHTAVDMSPLSYSFTAADTMDQSIEILRGTPSAHLDLEVRRLGKALTEALKDIPFQDRVDVALEIHLDGPADSDAELRFTQTHWPGKLTDACPHLAVFEQRMAKIAEIAPDEHEPAIYAIGLSSYDGTMIRKHLAGSPRQAAMLFGATQTSYGRMQDPTKTIADVFRVCPEADWQFSEV